MPVKLNDIAKVAGVSLATVSMALSGNPAISEATRSKVETIAHQLGYVPNQYAQKLMGKGKKVVGLIIPDITDLLCADMIQQLTAVTERRGMELSLTISNNSVQGEQKAIQELMQRGVDGILVIPSEQLPCAADDRFCTLVARNIPYVFPISRYTGAKAPCILSDARTAYRDAMRYVHDLGYISPVFIAQKENTYASMLKRAGFDDGMAKYYPEPKVKLTQRLFTAKGNDYEAGFQAATMLYNQRVETDVIFTENDLMGIGIINALKKIGIEIPEDVAVVSYGDTMFATVAPIPLTSIKPDLALIAERSIDRLFSSGTDAEEDLPAGSTLIERKSTANFFCNVR